MNLIRNAKPPIEALEALKILQIAGSKAIEHKRRLGQYWVVWDGEKPVKVNAENDPQAAE